MQSKQSLLKEYVLGDIKLKNRIVMAPMTRSRAENRGKVPTDLIAKYYEQRASAGLLITEGSQISEQAVGYINTPGIYSNEQVQGWKKVTKAVHDRGGKIFLQIWHVGRISHPDFHNGKLPLAPSAIDPESQSFTHEGFKKTVTPKEMSIDEIKQTVKDFGVAGKNALDSGFDGVEIHSSNGYLLHQFFSRSSNIREDEYGGSIEKRATILFEVIDELKKFVPENRIALRLNPSLHGMSGITVDEETIPTFDFIVKKLNDYNLAYLHLSEPFTDVSIVKGAESNVARHYRPLYGGTLIMNNGFDREKGNQIIDDDLSDLVAFGRPFISNPDLVERFAGDKELNPWDDSTFYSGGEKGFTDYTRSV